MSKQALKISTLSLLIASALGSVPSYAAARFDPALQPFGQVPPLALSGFNLSTGTQKAFQVFFDGNDWSGDVTAFPVGADGKTDVTARIWRAADVFASKQSCYAGDPTGTLTYYDLGRKIVTMNGSGVPFRWASLSGAQQASIGAVAAGQDILNFVRGDRSKEKLAATLAGDGTTQTSCGVVAPGVGTMRARGNIFGDILHGPPVYVGAPPADYLFDSYQIFKSTNSSRKARLYVGANDGMLHAFDASDDATKGEEVWAFVPSTVIPNLKLLAADPYTHAYFVDGGLIAGDVNFAVGGANWHTVLVGGLGAGGKGLFALDITSPDAATEAVAAAKVLWEISPATAGYADLGDTYASPTIVRLNTGKWAAIVGNGYNNNGSGHAVLYIIDIQTGALIKALDTLSGSAASPNGLSSPAVVDINFDGNADFVYAGDIDGNVWKFDISAAGSGSWTVASTPLYATGKSIVGAPDIVGHPLGGYIVYFATGRMFTAADAANATVQNYAYGIWDGAPVTSTALLDQTLTEKTYASSQRVRTSSALAINWNAGTPRHKGWRTALPAGESVIGTGFVRDARYHFTGVSPTVVNTPPPNGENWLVELDYLTGGVTDKLIFDLNGDSLLTDADRVGGGNTGIPVAVFEGIGLLSQPTLAILSAQLSTTIFNNNPFYAPSSQPGVPTPPSTDPGVSGGHFDVDLYYGTKDDHTHEYDDLFDVTGVNFLNASDPAKNISNAIASTATKFKILIANQYLSPAVNFSFGGQGYQKVIDLETTAGLTMAGLPTFDRTTIKTLKYNMPKDAFAIKDWGTGVSRVGLVPTQTGCVNGNAPGTLGPAGEYRNGALVWQLVKDTTPDSAVQQSQPGDPKYGYRLKDAQRATYLLAEWSTFWHHPNKKCMGDAGWVKDPPQDTSAPGKSSTPAAGSEDPPRDALGALVSSTSTTVKVPKTTPPGGTPPINPGGTTKTTTTTYLSGAQLIVTEYFDSKGKLISTTVTFVPAPGGDGSSGATGGSPNQGGGSPPNTVTGYQQTRSSGKLGRVTWHEMFRP